MKQLSNDSGESEFEIPSGGRGNNRQEQARPTQAQAAKALRERKADCPIVTLAFSLPERNRIVQFSAKANFETLPRGRLQHGICVCTSQS